MHTFNNFQRCFHAFGLFDRDNAFFTDFIHGFSNNIADGLIIVGRYGSHLGNFTLIFGRLAKFSQFRNRGVHCGINASFNCHRVVAGRNELLALFVDGTRQHGRRRCAITGHVTCLAGHFFDHLSAHIFKFVLQLNFLCHGHAVFGDCR